MENSEFERIKNKVLEIDPKRYWGDDFDVRFYLISKLKKLKNGSILDVGGGIGIVCSELDKSNFRINLDLSFQDLRTAKRNVDFQVQNICACMTNLPFINNAFDYVVCAHLLEIAKANDIKKKKIEKNIQVNQYPTVECTLAEISRIMKSKGTLFLTTPNNAYYRSSKLDYYELKNSLVTHFPKFSLSFYNNYPRLSMKHRKLNMANVIPKLLSKIISHEKIIKSLLRNDKGGDKESVSFYVEANKDLS